LVAELYGKPSAASTEADMAPGGDGRALRKSGRLRPSWAPSARITRHPGNPGVIVMIL